MKPEDVDGELVDDAVDAWHEMPRPALLDDQMRHFLAAVLPRYETQLRAERDAANATVERLEAACDGAGQHIGDVLRRMEEANATITRVREIHRPGGDPTGEFCRECDHRWPCPTSAALDATATTEGKTNDG